MKFFSIAALAGVASSHTIFTNLIVGSTVHPLGAGIRIPSYDGPITNVASNDIACNGGPNPTTPSNKVLDVVAGTTVKARWRHTQQSGPNDVVDAGHKGPVMAYMKKVNDATKDPGYGGGWFKISESGLLDGARQQWATDVLIKNLGDQEIPIPKCIASGQYLLRAELIALHGARTASGAQFYQECAQINLINGTGTRTPTTVSLPGAYKANDPGVKIDIYNPPPKTYVIPGPAVFTCE